MLIQNQEGMFTLIDTMIIHTMDGIHMECLPHKPSTELSVCCI